MKKVVVISMLAATLGATAVSPIMAQSSSQQSLQIMTASFSVNGKATDIRTIDKDGVALVSVRDIARAIEASLSVSGGTIKVQLNHNIVTLEGNALTLVGGNAFAEPASLLQGLGATYASTGNTVATIKLLSGIDHAVWANASQLIVSKTVENGREDYVVDAATGRNELLLASSDTSDLVVSKDGSQAAYTDPSGAVHIITLSTKQDVVASTDSSIKNELQWSNDGKSLFFLQGDKNSVIAKVDLADGKVTKLLEDKVDYKANLSVSIDGKQFGYAVIKQPKVTADSSKEVDLDDVAIDAAGTEPQLFYYNSADSSAKPLQLTTDKNDKAFPQIAANGSRLFYVSMGSDEESIGSLAAVDNAGKAATTLFAEQDVYQLVQRDGQLYLLTAKGDGNAIYSVDAVTGSAKLVQTVSDGVTELIVSNVGKLAALSNGVLAVENNGKFVTITN
ncbi:hypothetical protein [Paenibacillus sp. NEAU-GSW1]|uniref:TolB family protein n=1 Tax=Paenibacillus sp. NEAU-GSW1 TaxID=2682486 RepID=UPI001567041A|nr:hypothetical protein [Paenibacillus sp. NEAU-GSW1]